MLTDLVPYPHTQLTATKSGYLPTEENDSVSTEGHSRVRIDPEDDHLLEPFVPDTRL